MISKLAYIVIFGKPLIMYLGILTLCGFISTAILGILVHKGYRVPFKLHPILAMSSLALALIHGTLGLSIYFKF